MKGTLCIGLPPFPLMNFLKNICIFKGRKVDQTEIYQPIGNPNYNIGRGKVPGTAPLLPRTVQRICSKVGSILAIARAERGKVKPTFLQTGKRADVQWVDPPDPVI
uniref:Uncharacterized protein n=1 Tax=Micrurus spixii TaxID=129469 RepID=A0A2D4LTJ8_9SAUR